MVRSLEQLTMRKVYLRILPFAALTYFFCYLDRINVGFVLYFTYWFPDSYRARINAGFTLALPIAVATGAPISTALLGLDGLWGLKGWQVMYVLEAIPTVLIGIVVFFYLTDRPEKAG